MFILYRLLSAIWVFSLLTVSMAATFVQAPADQNGIQNAIERLFRASERQDLDGVMACWSRKSPEYDSFKKWIEERFTVSRKEQVSNLTFTRWKISFDNAEVYVRFNRKWRKLVGKQVLEANAALRIRLVKEEGEWKWAQMWEPAPELAGRICAIEKGEERAQLMRDERDILTGSVADVLREEAERLSELDNVAEAQRICEFSFEVANFLADDSQLAFCSLTLGMILAGTGDGTESLKNFEQSLSLFEKLSNAFGQVDALLEIANFYLETDQYSKSREKAFLAVKVAQDNEDREGAGLALVLLGRLSVVVGERAVALSALETSLKIGRELKKPDIEILALDGLGSFNARWGDYDTALDWFAKARALCKQVRDTDLEFNVASNVALLNLSNGNLQLAILEYEEVAKKAHNKRLRAIALSGLGVINFRLNNTDEAMEKFDASLNLARTISSASVEAGALANKAFCFVKKEQYSEGLKTARSAFGIAARIENTPLALSAARAAAMALGLSDDYEGAIEVLNLALRLSTRSGLKSEEGHLELYLGAAFADDDKYDLAEAHLQSALKTGVAIGDSMLMFMANEYLGYVNKTKRNTDTAISYYKAAIARLSEMRSKNTEPLLQATMLGSLITYHSPHLQLAKLLMEKTSDLDGALALIDEGKARSLVDIMTKGGIDLMTGLTDREKQEQQALTRRIRDIEVQLAENSVRDSVESTALRRKREDALAEEFSLRLKFFYNHSDLQFRNAHSDPLTLSQLKQVFANEPNACVLSYSVDYEDATLLVITRLEGADYPKATWFQLKTEAGEDLSRSELAGRVSELRKRMTEFGAYKRFARSLYALLLAPAKDILKNKAHLIILPDGPLNALPFQTLLDEQDKHLIDTFTISYAPSIATLLKIMQRSDERKKLAGDKKAFLIMGRQSFTDDAEYVGGELSEDQAKSISDLVGVKPYLDSQATKATALAEMPKARYIHLTTHGELNEASPMYSAIILAKGTDDNGKLYARDLMDLKLQAELVALSACDSGRGKQVDGEGLLGLSWALFVAGSSTNIVTQWGVAENSMKKLMLGFYKQLQQAETTGNRISKAVALRRAQLSLMNDENYRHPYYWAPVVLIGDWR